MLFDHHTHSCHSFDGSEPIEALAEAAVSRGLHALAVTDHCDLGLQCLPDWEERLSGSMEEISKNRAAFQGRLTLLAGIELGQPLHDLQRAADVLVRFPCDLVIGSLHNLRETEDFYFLQDAGADPQVLLDRYFDELLEMTRWGGFDILAHLTYPYRYLGYTDTPPITCFEEKLREIFTSLARGGKALELNTSGLVRSPAGGRCPSFGSFACSGNAAVNSSRSARTRTAPRMWAAESAKGLSCCAQQASAIRRLSRGGRAAAVPL